MRTPFKLHVVILILLFGISTSLFSQYQSRGVAFDEIAAFHFYNAKNFYDAIPLFEKLVAQQPTNNSYLMKIGICHL
jgi:hypothetical protein